MNFAEIEENVQALMRGSPQDDFVYGLLAAYGLPKASITRLRQGAYNLSKTSGEVLWKKKIYFREVHDQDLHAFIDAARKSEAAKAHEPRFVVVTDQHTLLAYD